MSYFKKLFPSIAMKSYIFQTLIYILEPLMINISKYVDDNMNTDI